MKYITKTEKQTLALGKKIAKTLKGGEVLALSGDLGAGKTVFTKGLAAGLGVKKIITSPTFILMNVYKHQARNTKHGTLVHIDCYRLTSAEDLKNIGATEYFGQSDTIVVIEWAEKVKSILPKKYLKLYIKISAKGGQDFREIVIT